jgi:hypothetical protein
MMRGFRRTDKPIERNVQRLIELPQQLGVSCGEFKRGYIFPLRGLNHFLSMLVGAGQKEHILAVEPLEARQRVRGNRLIGMSDMWRAVRIHDRRGDVECIRTRR